MDLGKNIVHLLLSTVRHLGNTKCAPCPQGVHLLMGGGEGMGELALSHDGFNRSITSIEDSL